MATQRLSESAERLQDLVRDNGDQVEAIAGVSRTAMDNMDKLRGDLPVIANAARDMSNQIGAAGTTAHDQLDELVGGFNRLNEFGQASERQVASLRAKVDAALAAFEAQAAQLDEIAGTRFTALRERSELFRTELDGREVEALAAMRHRAERLRAEIGTSADELEAQEAELLKSLQARVAAIRESADTIGESLTASEREAVAAWARRVAMFKEDFEVAVGHVETIDTAAKKGAEERLRTIREEAELVDAKLTESHAMFVTEVEKRRAEAAAIGMEQADGIAAKLAEFDAAIALRRAEHAEISQRLVGESAELSQRIAALSGEMERAAGQGEHARGMLAAAVDALAERLTSSRDALGDTDRAVAALTDASVRLLELIRASATHSREELPLAIGDAEARLTALGERGEALGLMLGQAAERSHEVSEYVLGAQRESASAIEGIAAFRHRNTQAHEETLGQLAQLRDRLRAVADDSEALSASARGALSEAIETLGTAARDALAGIESDAGERIETLAAGIADRSKVALDEALQQRVGEALAELETGAAQAAGVGREAAVQLRDQLAKVNELAGQPRKPRRDHAPPRGGAGRQRFLAPRRADYREPQQPRDRHRQRARQRRYRHRVGELPARRPRHLHAPRGAIARTRAGARRLPNYYDANGEFREHVNRYIHDFEANAADDAVDPRWPRDRGHPAVERHGQALRRAGPGDRAAAGLSYCGLAGVIRRPEARGLCSVIHP